MSKKLTPMMEQYYAIKERYKEELLFFRLGDFYELFFDDALTASRELNITLTGRAAGMEDKAPMCGVPFHAAENYIMKLIQKGYKVAICEQVEDPAEAKGIVKRDVVRLITPGTVLSEQTNGSNANNFMSLFYKSGHQVAVLFTDISTGEIIWSLYEEEDFPTQVIDALAMYNPTEIILVNEREYPPDVARYLENNMPNTALSLLTKEVLAHKGCHDVDVDETSLAFIGREHFKGTLSESTLVYGALGALYLYLQNVIKVPAEHMTNISTLQGDHRMIMDASCLRHLEITRNLRDGGSKGTLFQVLDKTATPMGTRLLKQWIENPLLEVGPIEYRQEAVQEMKDNNALRTELKDYLQSIFDFERILTRIETGSASPKDMVSLRESFRVLPYIKALLGPCRAKGLRDIEKRIRSHDDLLTLLDNAIAPNPPFTMKEGRVINDGYHEELDELRALASNSQAWLARLEEEIKEKTGIKLKTGYNKVFGYYFEVTNTHSENVPDYFIRKQTLANAERYITPELKEFEIKILSAKDKIIALENQLFQEVRQILRASICPVQQTARALAEVDVFRSLGEIAFEGRYIRPQLNQQGRITIKDGRHPVIEKFLKREVYVPNDITLNHEENEFILITGPNMAGKSTYMRQVAILMIMAQMGSFIPAREATISPVDRIFTRVGASDDISTGQSTFMVEMMEVAYILANATSKSLIILDEIGRGTSTFDGLSIAKAVVEHILKYIKAKTLFATHYHELISLESEYDHLKNYTVAVKEKGKDVIFLRRIIRGGADRSYGIHVARLAGLPNKVLKRAEDILELLESSGENKAGLDKVDEIVGKEVPQETIHLGSLFDSSVLGELKAVDVMSMTPIEALNCLYSLQEKARKGDGK